MKRWNPKNLNDEHRLNEYKNVLQMKLNEKQESNQIEREWCNIKECIIEAAEETIGVSGKKERNEWWDDECRAVILEKNKARLRCLKRETRANNESYKQKRREAKIICKKKKKEWLNNKIKEIDNANMKNMTRKFYKDLKYYNKCPLNQIGTCKDIQGKLISDNNQILRRWEQYFNSILNTVLVENVGTNYKEIVLNNDEVNPPSYLDIELIVNQLRNNKSPGNDRIIAEFIKNGGIQLKKRLHKLICTIWEKEEIPEEWHQGIICPIYKKGDRAVCSNYRGITLLNVTYKIFSIYVCEKLTEIIENKLDDCQMGFRPNRSTIDNIHIVKQIYEKFYEYNIEAHNLFIDFENAFDSVNRIKVFRILEDYNVPGKLIKLIMLTLTNTVAKIKIGNSYTEFIKVNSGVRQGDPISATLFSIIIDSVIKKLEIRGNISVKSKQLCAYADDVLVVARTHHAMVETFNKLKKEAEEVGLIINVNKTKYMKCSRNKLLQEKITIDNLEVENVQSFKYLGVLINGHNSIEEEIKARIAAGNRAFYANKKFLQNKILSRESKIKIYNTLIKPVIMYACELWVLKKQIEQKLLIFERKILRKIFGSNRQPDGSWKIKTNIELDNIMNHKNIVREIKSRRLAWLGHVERKEDDCNLKRITYWKPIANRPRGRPKIEWFDDVRGDIKKMKINNWKMVVKDREEWMKIVELAKTHLEL